MTKNNRNSRQRNNNQLRERSASPLQNNNNKKRNTTQTLEVPPKQSTSQTVTPVIMNFDPTSQTKGKELETFDLSKGNSLITPHNIDETITMHHLQNNNKTPTTQTKNDKRKETSPNK
ncbi:4368_t:CDS:2 [Funneliformis geosporum]|nr:4368_t:CDS:2 [Funneliformis geosporum]